MLLPSLDLAHDCVVDGRVDLHIVVAQSEVVEVEVFIDVLVPAAGELEHLRADGLIIGRDEPIPIIVLEVTRPELEEGADIERPQREHPSG